MKREKIPTRIPAKAILIRAQRQIFSCQSRRLQKKKIESKAQTYTFLGVMMAQDICFTLGSNTLLLIACEINRSDYSRGVINTCDAERKLM